VLQILTSIRDGFAFMFRVGYDTGITLLENGNFLMVFIVVMIVLMITGWTRDKPTV
jgi:hypothetical protein